MQVISKILGIIMISGTICICGFVYADQLKKSSQIKQGLLELLYYIKLNISNGALPLCEIYSGFKNPPLEASGFLPYLRNKGGHDALSLSLSEYSQKLALPEKDMSELLNFSVKIGKSARLEGELELLDRYISILERSFHESRVQNEKKQLLFRRLGIIGGFMAATLLM